MANGLITSYFASSRQVDEATEKQNHLEDAILAVPPAGESGLTVDLGGLLSSEDHGHVKKKKRRRKKKGHKHLAKLSKDDSYVALDEEVKVQEVEEQCEEVLIMDPDEEVVWLSPLKRVAALSSQWQQLFKKKSPVKKTVSSPKRCRSPRQPAALKQTHRSPSKQTSKRQLLATPITTKTADPCTPSVDHAPYTRLVHIQQIDTTPTHLHTPTLKIKSTHSPLPSQIKCTQSLGLCAHIPLQSTAPSFETISDTSLHLNLLLKSHSSTNISALYSRYRCLTGTTTPASPSDDSLPCQIAIRLDGQKINVDTTAYPKPIQLHSHMHSDLWTRVYRPRKSSEVIGNSCQCSCLCAWLRRWKVEETPQPVEKKKEKAVTQKPQRKAEGENCWWMTDRDEDFVLPHEAKRSKRKSYPLSTRYLDGDSDGEMEVEDDLCPVMVVSGPAGSGKTAAVYACAEELGFGVYEINSSSSRGRAQMLSTLREVTLSHLVAQRKNGLSCVQNGDKKLPQMVSLESNTLILLEEVDILFGDEDRGFWSAVYEVVHSTKRPFVMTCSGSDVKLACPHSLLTFSRPPMCELALHIQLLSIAHGLYLSLESANQIVASFNSDIRKTFHFMHTWLSWHSNTQHDRSHGNTAETPPQSLTPTGPLYLSTSWRINHRSFISTSSSTDQSDLSIAAATADNLATVDILTSTLESEPCPVAPWWRVAPTNHLLDELSGVGDNSTSLQSSGSIAKEISRICGTTALHQQSSAPFPLHHSLKTCTKAFSPCWQLARVSMATEGLPFLRLISISEEQRRVACVKRRFHHYLKYCSDDVSIESLKMLTNSNLV